ILNDWFALRDLNRLRLIAYRNGDVITASGSEEHGRNKKPLIVFHEVGFISVRGILSNLIVRCCDMISHATNWLGKTSPVPCQDPGKIVSKFVSPFVSPGGSKMGRFLITSEESNNCLRHSDAAICVRLITSAKSSENAVLA